MNEDYQHDWTDEALYPAHKPAPREFRGTAREIAFEVLVGVPLLIVSVYGSVFLAAVLQGVVG